MEVESIRTIAVVGAGQMGSGIAEVCARAGYRVRLADVSLERAEAGKRSITAAIGRLVGKGKLPPLEGDQLVERIEPVSPEAVAPADIAIEAASESLELKLALFERLDRELEPGALLLSNTSSISLTELGAATARPAQVAGMHFMNPVPLMKLVEVVRGLQTSDETLAAVIALAERLGKAVIVSRDRPGFVVNRMLLPLVNEACFALDEGLASAEDIDQGARLGLNHPMGPLELADLVGLDTVLAIADVLHRGFGDDKYRAAPLLRNLVAAGWLGRKSGRGFYAYDASGKKLADAGDRS